MNQQKLDNNPEFAFHYERVHRNRSEKRIRLFNAIYRAKMSKRLAQLSSQELARRFERAEQTGEE